MAERDLGWDRNGTHTRLAHGEVRWPTRARIVVWLRCWYASRCVLCLKRNVRSRAQLRRYRMRFERNSNSLRLQTPIAVGPNEISFWKGCNRHGTIHE